MKIEATCTLPDGIYTATIGGCNAQITSKDFEGKVIVLPVYVKTTDLHVVVVVKKGIANFNDKSVPLSDANTD